MIKLQFHDKELWRILSKENLKELEKEVPVKIEMKKGANEATFLIKGKNAVHEYIAGRILEAISAGFDFDTAVLLKEEDVVFKEVKLKNYAHGSRLSVVKGRIVGSQGKSKRVIQQLSECYICLCDNKVGIIGRADNVEIASKAIESLIRGSKHANVFKSLEESRKHLRELNEEDILRSLKE
jgi:ribosomal RNA assembly protein